MGVEQIYTPLQIPHQMGNLEVFGFALHLFVKVLRVMGDESTLAHFGVICVWRVGAFWHHMHSDDICTFGIIYSK